MLKTKDRILFSALEVFNEAGVTGATLRGIAALTGISQGNLNYHFPTKEELVEALYFQLVEKLDLEFARMEQPGTLLAQIYQSSRITMKLLYQYRFLLRDLYKIMKDYPMINQHYLALQAARKIQFETIQQQLIVSGILRTEDFPAEYQRLYERMNIMGDNWINAMELLRNEDPDRLDYFVDLLFETLYPYLTDKGKLAYKEVIGE